VKAKLNFCYSMDDAPSLPPPLINPFGICPYYGSNIALDF